MIIINMNSVQIGMLLCCFMSVLYLVFVYLKVLIFIVCKISSLLKFSYFNFKNNWTYSEEKISELLFLIENLYNFLKVIILN